MPLTPADVHNVAFKKPPIGKRGYDEEEVDKFLDEIENELARLIEENNDLKGQVERGERMPADGTPDGEGRGADADVAAENAALRARIDQLEAQLRETGESAEASAAAVAAVAESPDESERALSVLMTAQRTANELVADARREAERLLTDARSRAQELSRDAEGRATALDYEARKRYEETMGGLEVKRVALHKHIEDLGAFEREYRTRLRSYLEGQMHDLDGRARILEDEMGRVPSPQEAANAASAYGAPATPPSGHPGG